MKIYILMILLSVSVSLFSAVSFVRQPSIEKVGDSFKVVFELSEYSDVEVAVVDTVSDVILCHLAAGKLGPKAPPPLVINSLRQELFWNGRDDYRNTVQVTTSLSVRVRVGMSAKIDRIAGGDPYAFFTREMTAGNHSVWTIAGIEGKSDGSVYVYGSSNQMGVYTIRKYDSDGNYIKTVFPFPSGFPSAKVAAWGVNVRPDGTYSPKVAWGNSWPIYTTTPINMMSGFGPQPLLIHNKDTSKLTIAASNNFALFSLNTDGTIESQPYSGYITENPKLIAVNNGYNKNIKGALFITYTPDSSSFYMSGVCSTGSAFWREGQVWKVDVATRTAQKWFALTSNYNTNPGTGSNFAYTALHGTAVDDSHHVFLCNRVSNQVMVLDSNANVIKTISVLYPDAVEYDKSTGALYVATRFGMQSAAGNVKLLKFNNWRTDIKPAYTVKLCDVFMSILSRDRVYILIRGTGASKRIWVAFKDIGAQIFKESGDTLELVKDFYQSGKKQRFLGFQRMTADPVTENLYIASGDNEIFKLTDWNTMGFAKCSLDVVPPAKFMAVGFGVDDRQIVAPDVTIDARNRYLYAPMHPNYSAAYRFTLDGQYHKFAPINSSGSSKVSGLLITNESDGCLYRDRGLVPSPDGGIVSVYGWGSAVNDYQNVHLQYHYINPVTGDSIKIDIDSLGGRTGGVRMDLKGNVYAGARLGPAWTAPDSVPPGYAGDDGYRVNIGKIYKYTPTGTFEPGKLFNNTSRLAPAKVYNVGYGRLPVDANGFNPRFGVDYYGRIYYPNSLTQTVAVMDNEGNQLLSFGAYGNLDAWLSAQTNPSTTSIVPLSWPNSVDATEDYIYVADYVNSGVVRMKKEYVLDNLSGSSFGHVVAEGNKVRSIQSRILSVYPNPFRMKNVIQLNSGKEGPGTVKVYDLRGRVLAVLADGLITSGLHTFEWDGRKQAAGIYFVKVQINGNSYQKRIVKY